MESPRVKREDVEEWGDDSTRVDVDVDVDVDADVDSPASGSASGSTRKSKSLGKRKGKGKELDSPTPASAGPSTSTSSSSSKKPNTRSSAKGKEREGKKTKGKPASETINARFEINPDANEGLEYQYDEVVRGKHKRSRMCAVDCEDCRAVSILLRLLLSYSFAPPPIISLFSCLCG